MNGFTSKVLHTWYKKKDAHGALKMPVYENAAFECESAQDLSLAFQGEKAFHTYSRSSNPTVEYFEHQVQHLTGADAVLAVASGMAAISNLIMAIGSSGSNIITTRYLFGNTYSLFNTTLKDWGLETRFVDLKNRNDIETAIDSKTIAVFAETVSNPQLEVADFSLLSGLTGKYGIPLIADTTLTPLYLFDAKNHGIDIEVLSSTKFISGGGTTIGGLVIDYGTYDWSQPGTDAGGSPGRERSLLVNKLRRDVYRNFGACMSPHTAYLQSLGLETLALRIDKTCTNARLVADFLKKHAKVADVQYPGLNSHGQYDLAKKQFPKGAGGLLNFDLHSKEQCFKLIDQLQLIRRATNLNANQSLIIHPASTIYCEYNRDELSDLGIRDTMIRLAVGIEDFDDIKADLEQALEVM